MAAVSIHRRHPWAAGRQTQSDGAALRLSPTCCEHWGSRQLSSKLSGLVLKGLGLLSMSFVQCSGVFGSSLTPVQLEWVYLTLGDKARGGRREERQILQVGMLFQAKGKRVCAK